MEAEVSYLFIIGVAIVVITEAVLVAVLRKGEPKKSRALLCHALCILAAFACLGYLLFGIRVAPDGTPLNGSGLFAGFGIFWFVGEVCLVKYLVNARDKPEN